MVFIGKIDIIKLHKEFKNSYYLNGILMVIGNFGYTHKRKLRRGIFGYIQYKK
jgi:hypothetical protein